MKNPRAYDSYFGGKNGNGTYQTIINHIPPHRAFCSLFLGNCGVYQHIKPAEMAFLNDIDQAVISAWRMAFKGTPEGVYLTAYNAIDFIVILRCLVDETTLQGVLRSYLGDYARKDVFIYLDPPYRLSSRKDARPVYNYKMSDDSHEQLLQTVIGTPEFPIMISHYPDPLYDEYLKDWNQVDFLSTTRNGLAIERLYMNYELTGELHDYTYLGGDFRERERNNRIKSNFIKKLNRLSPELRNAILMELQNGKAKG